MTKPQHIHLADVQGLSRLAVDATLGLTDVVEATHDTIAGAPWPGLGIRGRVYHNIRQTTRLVGRVLNLLLAQFIPHLAQVDSTPARDEALAILNGVVGDYLCETANPLAIPMRLRQAGRPLELDRPALAAAFPPDGGPDDGRILLLVHGLCRNDLHWQRLGHDHGAALARDLGYTPLYLHYNSGLHISSNGAALTALLEELLANWPAPVTELVIVAHSMGGLVTRSACQIAAQRGHTWPGALRKIVFIGTPHHGSPLERGGNWIDRLLAANPYSAPFARLGHIRSAGITDLHHGNLCDNDWQGRDRFRDSRDRPQSLPLPPGVTCYAIAAANGEKTVLNDLLANDGLVPLASALGEHRNPEYDLKIPAERKWVGRKMGHFDLLSHPEVYARIKEWIREKPEG